MTVRRGLLSAAIAFEWRYHTRQPSFLAGVAIFTFFGFFLTMGLGGGEMTPTRPR